MESRTTSLCYIRAGIPQSMFAVSCSTMSQSAVTICDAVWLIRVSASFRVRVASKGFAGPLLTIIEKTGRPWTPYIYSYPELTIKLKCSLSENREVLLSVIPHFYDFGTFERVHGSQNHLFPSLETPGYLKNQEKSWDIFKKQYVYEIWKSICLTNFEKTGAENDEDPSKKSWKSSIWDQYVSKTWNGNLVIWTEYL